MTTRRTQFARGDRSRSCRWMKRRGLNQGTSGNISARYGDGMLITPSAIPYDAMQPEMIAVDAASTANTAPGKGRCGPPPNGASTSTS